MEHIIKAAVDRGASDLHIKAGDVFRARIDGEFVALTKQRLTPEQTKGIALQMISNKEVRENIDSIRDYDCTSRTPLRSTGFTWVARRRATSATIGKPCLRGVCTSWVASEADTTLVS